LLSETGMTSNTVHPVTRKPKSNCRILIVDDNADAAMTMAVMLELQGHTVRYITSPLEAVATALELKPHVVLLDIGMPVLNGFDVAGLLRKHFGPQVHIVAVSGFADPASRARAVQAGFDGHFEKPADTLLIQATVQRACSKLRAQQ
jgi:CheY-like chemotaxis protein